jgi:hypothetical protein
VIVEVPSGRHESRLHLSKGAVVNACVQLWLVQVKTADNGRFAARLNQHRHIIDRQSHCQCRAPIIKIEVKYFRNSGSIVSTRGNLSMTLRDIHYLDSGDLFA